MPSFPFTPTRLTLTGADIQATPVRFAFTPALLALSLGADWNFGVAMQATDGNTLPRLQRQQVYFADGKPTQEMQLRWQRTMERIEARFGNVEDILAKLQQVQETASQAAQTANATQATTTLANSYTNPVSVLTATSDGSVAIAAHSRVYGDGTSVAVNAGSVNGFTSGNYVTVFYNDPARTGGAVAYTGTTDAVAQTGDRHIVGSVTIPDAGAAPALGTGPTAPGYTAPTQDPDDPLIQAYRKGYF